jgi:hypothetical protein
VLEQQQVFRGIYCSSRGDTSTPAFSECIIAHASIMHNLPMKSLKSSRCDCSHPAIATCLLLLVWWRVEKRQACGGKVAASNHPPLLA